jgi:tRNA dimethylallyltransferase
VKPPIVITGATASGKTRLAIALAQAVAGEVISVDSRQVYCGMDVGTAKPTLEEREGVPHFGFDLVQPDERYSAGRFARDARAWLAEIGRRGNVAILAGGTGFFLRALTHPLFREPALDEERRSALRTYLGQKTVEELRRWVEALEPGSTASEWRGGGRQRLVRRLEVALLSGRPLSWWQASAPATDRPVRALTFVLERPRDELYARIERRVEDMVRRGLADEVRGLLESGFTLDDPGMNATGYIEMVPHVRGERSLEQAVELIQAATRRYARRQLTWFRNQLAVAHRLDATQPVTRLRDEILRIWKGSES